MSSARALAMAASFGGWALRSRRSRGPRGARSSCASPGCQAPRRSPGPVIPTDRAWPWSESTATTERSATGCSSGDGGAHPRRAGGRGGTGRAGPRGAYRPQVVGLCGQRCARRRHCRRPVELLRQRPQRALPGRRSARSAQLTRRQPHASSRATTGPVAGGACSAFVGTSTAGCAGARAAASRRASTSRWDEKRAADVVGRGHVPSVRPPAAFSLGGPLLIS